MNFHASRVLLGLALAAGATLAAPTAWAAEPSATIVGTGIDANTFIPGHPASPRWKLVHANAEHPAVLQARRAHEAAIDANTFLVQPPASTTWLAQGDGDAALKLAQAQAPTTTR